MNGMILFSIGEFFFDSKNRGLVTYIIVGAIILAAVLGFAVPMIINAVKNKQRKKVPQKDALPKNITEAASFEIRKNDPEFSNVDLLTFAEKSFKKIRSAKDSGNLSGIRNIVTEDFYRVLSSAGKKSYDPKEKLSQSFVSEHKTEGSREYLDICIETLIPSDTGDARDDRFLGYILKLSRDMNDKTHYLRGITTLNCKSCYGILDKDELRRCPYCGSRVSVGTSMWDVCDMYRISERQI